MDQIFHWEYSDNSFAEGGEIPISATDDAFATSAELQIASLQIDASRYFIVDQTTNIDAGVFDGCQSDYARVQVDIFNRPAAPTTADDDLYFCELVDNGSGNTITDITVSGEGNAGDEFRWYASLTDVDSETVMFTGATISATDLIPDETDDEGNSLTNLGGLLANSGTYTFYVTQATDIDAGASPDFSRGSEGDPLEITIYVRTVPEAPTILDSSPTICETELIPTLQVANTVGHRYTWIYDANDNDLPDDTKLVDEQFQSTYDPAQTSPGVYTYLVSQITDKQLNGSLFAGCESPYASLDFTIHDIPAPPTITGNGTANEYVYCADETFSNLEIDNEADYNGTATYNWYRNSNSTGVITNTADPTAGTELAADDNDNFPNVTEETDAEVLYYVTTVEDGCESSLDDASNNTEVTFTINRLPDVEIVFESAVSGFSANDLIDGAELCFDEGSISVKGIEQSDDAGSQRDAVNTNGTIVWTISTDGLTALNGGNSASVDITTAALFNGNGVEDDPTSHDINFNYTDNTTGCTNDITRTVTFNPLPTLEIYSGGDPLEGQEFCYDEQTITLSSTHETGANDETSIFSNATFSVNTGNSSLTDNLNGTAAINLKIAMANESDSTGFYIKHGYATSHTVSLTYTDSEGCVSTITRDFVVNPHPTLGIEYNEAIGANVPGDPIDGSAICYSEDAFEIRGIQEGVTAVPADGTLSWDISTGGLTADGGTGLSTLDPPTAAFAGGALDSLADNTLHDITFEFTDLNGCTTDTLRTVQVTKLPTLNIVVQPGDNNGGSEFCTSTDEVTLQGQEDGVDVNAGIFTINTGVSGVSGASDDGTGIFYPAAGHINFGLPMIFDPDTTVNVSDHIVTFTYTSPVSGDQLAACQNSVNTVVSVNPIPYLQIYADDLEDDAADFLTSSLDDDELFTEVCESQDDFTLIAQRNTTTGGLGQFFFNNDPVVTSRTGSEDRVLFQPRSLAENEILTESGDYNIRYEYTNIATGCYNEIEKDITVHVLPEVFAEVIGGCVDPRVSFNAQLLEDTNITTDRPSPYELGDMTYTWNFYEANQDGIIQFDSPFADEDDVSEREGENVSHNFSGFNGLAAQFGVVMTAQHNITGCKSDQEVGITEEVLLIRIDPNTSAVWDGVTVGGTTSFYVNELQLDLERIIGITITDLTDNNVILDLTWDPEVDPSSIPYGMKDGHQVFGPFDYVFANSGLHEIRVDVTNINNCDDFLLRNVNIVPLIPVVDEYYESFDGIDSDLSGWFVETLVDDALIIPQAEDSDDGMGNVISDDYGVNQLRESSWVYQALDLTDNDGESVGLAGVSGAEGWMTGVNGGYLQNEDSWLYSPAFDISNLQQPMVSFSAAYNFSQRRDGAVLQYSLDDGLTWEVLGSYNSTAEEPVVTGLNWYNYDNVQADPGQAFDEATVPSPMGWSGGEEDGQEVEWVTAKHKLDLIPDANRDFVRFRFAMSSTSDSDTTGYFGFALDDFRIHDREKNVMIENFVVSSNTAGLNSKTNNIHGEIDVILNGGPNNPPTSSGDEIVLDYHIDVGIDDPFNRINPADPGARRFFYSVDEVTSILDGGSRASETDDSKNISWTSNDFNLSSLGDPGVRLTVADNGSSASEILGTIELEALRSFETDDELVVYLAVLEDTVRYDPTDANFIGDFQPAGESTSIHTNVLRKLLPSAAGHFIKFDYDLDYDPNVGPVVIPANGVEGGGATINIQWDMVNIKDASQLSVVAFVQDNRTKEIYQALKFRASDNLALVSDKNSTDDGSLITGVEELRNTDFSMYPNPSNDLVTVKFDAQVSEGVEWVLFDQTGRVFDQGVETPGFDRFRIETRDFPAGMYYISIKGDTHDFKYRKLVIAH